MGGLAAVSAMRPVSGLRALDRVVETLVGDELMEQWHARAGGGAADQELSAVDLRHRPN